MEKREKMIFFNYDKNAESLLRQQGLDFIVKDCVFYPNLEENKNKGEISAEYVLILEDNFEKIKLLHNVTGFPIHVIVNSAIREFIETIQQNPLSYLDIFFSSIDLITVFKLISVNVKEELTLKYEKENK